MKAIRNLALVLTVLFGGTLLPAARAATYTDGTNTFTVTLVSLGGSYSPRHVDAYWIATSNGTWVQNIRKDSGTRQGYLYQWAAVRGNTTIDGYSGATVSSGTGYVPVTVTWDGRDANNVIMPDGTYRFYVEYTDRNGQGAWTTNGISFTKGTNSYTTNPASTPYLTAMTFSYLPALAYDIAVTGISPAVGIQNMTVPVVIAVTNATSMTETFTLTLSNLTTSSLIGTQLVTAMVGNTASNFTINWNTTGLAVGNYNLRAYASTVAGETNTADNVFNATIAIVTPTHDVAVTSLTPPSPTTPSSVAIIPVAVTNKGGYTETFSVVLTDLTEARAIVTNQVSNLAPFVGTTVNMSWTVSTNLGLHTLRAVAGPVASETATADNTNVATMLVTPPYTTNMFIVRSNTWRYSDTGTDLGTAWQTTNYDDSTWSQNLAPLGYGDPETTFINSNVPPSTDKIVTTYFRKTFTIDSLPLPTALLMNLRRDDGVVVYHNGVEIYRFNLTNYPTPVYFSNLALVAIGGTDETTYFPTNLAATNCVLGTNTIAVEVHQNSLTSSDLSFDLELLGVIPPVAPLHDLEVTSITAPGQVPPNSTTNISVNVRNKGNFTETFAVVLTDTTDSSALGTSQVSNLGSNTSTIVTFPWSVPAVPFVTHNLRAVAVPVLGEISIADNTNTVAVLVSPLMETNVFISRSNYWRYNDTGTDLTFTPWKLPGYYDAAWPVGQGSLGYGDAQSTYLTQSNPPSTSKLPTYYFRKVFTIDTLPSSMIMRLRRDDGAVVYHNGVEIFRTNMAAGLVYYTNWANATVDGTGETTYYESPLSVTNAVVGENVVAVEVHQVSATSSDISFDLELLGINPVFTRIHNVAALGLSAPAGALAGDRLPITVTLTNRGNVAETALLVLKDAITGQLIGTRTISGLAAGGTTAVQIDWATLGATNGTHTVQAFTVIGGVTNFAGATTGPATLTGSGFGLNAATVLGSVGGRCSAVTASGSLLLVGVGATLEVWDRANPAVPAKVGSVRLPGLIEDIVVSGTFAYAACGSAGVQFVDISTPATPAHVNTYDTSGHATRLAVSPGMLYVADGVAGLRIVNINSPSTPSLVGTYYTAGPARAVAVGAGATIYVLDGHTGLLALSIANPAAPALLGAYTGLDAGQDLAVVGSYAYVVDANNHFYVLNVATPSAPTLVNATNSFLLTNLVAQSLKLNGTTAYVPAGDGGLAILNITTPATPVFVGTVTTPGQAVAAAVAGTTLYLADGFHGLQVYDVTTATSPALQTDLPTSIRACDVAVNSSLAFVAAGEGGLRIYNVASPATPVWLGWFAGALNARCVAVSGSTAYVGDGQYGLKVVNVATPASPALLGSWTGTNLASIRNIGASGSLVVASDGSRVCLFNVSAPTSPTLVATCVAPAFAFDMTVSGTRAYLACGNAGFVILDISASALTQRSVTDTPGLASGISVTGNSAYVADGANGWLIYDVSNPAAPSLVKANAAQGPVSSVAVSGVLATLGNGANAAVTMDVTTPLAPVNTQTFAGLANALRVTAASGQAYVSENDAGLAVLSTGEAPLVLQVVPPAGGSGDLSLKWVSKPGKTYAIYKSTNLTLGRAGFSLVQGNIAATPPLNSVPVNLTGNGAFYIISEE